MPPVRTSRMRKPPPTGFDDIEDTLLEFSNKMKDAENATHEGKKRHEVMWPIFQISHQRMYRDHIQMPPATLHAPSLHLPFTYHLQTSHDLLPKLILTSRISIHLRPILRKVRHLQTPLRMATEEQLRRRGPDRKVEETGLRKAVLPAMRADERDKL